MNDFMVPMKELIATALTPSINVENRLADNLWSVEIDPGDLEDAILNLALNARDAMPEGGALVIETANRVLDENYVKNNPSATVGDFVMISVSDTGTGMTDEVKEKLFEPFFTTKEVGEGTGLGLSMVYGFVERSRGHIKVYSEPGAGTTFRIYLPRTHEKAIEAETASDRQIKLPHGSETILIVDDEEALRIAAVLYLEALGYKILTANNGQQALEVLNDHQGIDLMFCDVIMPGELDGYRVALAARERNPALKILLTSGFTRKREGYATGDGSYLSSLANSLLSKPYNHEELAFAIRRTLDGES
ncbi:MAG: response regulator [Alphaproteobacteria bacterium]|nr:response regulator [Alphaproteobacteria bacterium]